MRLVSYLLRHQSAGVISSTVYLAIPDQSTIDTILDSLVTSGQLHPDDRATGWVKFVEVALEVPEAKYGILEYLEPYLPPVVPTATGKQDWGTPQGHGTGRVINPGDADY